MLTRSARAAWAEIAARLTGRRVAVFLDYDGTLTPIVSRPELAVLAPETRGILRELAACCPVAIISGRDREEVVRLVGVPGLWIAGSHGFDIGGPGVHLEVDGARQFLPALDGAERALRDVVSDVPGALVERKRFSLALHYRNVAPGRVPDLDAALTRVERRFHGLRRAGGKMVFELRPALDWDKGRAVSWLLDHLGVDPRTSLPLYVGDDVTDEDAFRALAGRGIGVLVGPPDRRTGAEFFLRDPAEVALLLRDLVRGLREGAGR